MPTNDELFATLSPNLQTQAKSGGNNSLYNQFGGDVVKLAKFMGGDYMNDTIRQEYVTRQGGTTPIKPAGLAQGTSSVIVTSGASRNNYANNVNTLNNANNSISSGNQNGSDISNLPVPGTQKAVYGADGNLSGYTQSDGSFVDISGKKTTQPSSQKPTDGSTIITNDDGSTYSLPAGVDPSVGKMLNDNIIAMNTTADNAKATMDSAAATLADDPAAVAAANNIKAQFDVLIRQMEEKNKILLGSYAKNSARTGMMQYANEMDTNFKSEEIDKSVQRIGDLIQKESDAIMKSNAAYKAGDVKALDAATKDYQKILEDKQKAIMDLNKTINDTVKTNQAELKLKQAEAKQQITDDIRVSASVGKSMAEAIEKSGVTDEKQINEYIMKMAEANGISNPDILKSALVKEQQALDSLTLKNKNTESIIKKREAPKVTGTKSTIYKNFTNKPTASVITKVNTYLASIGATKADIDKVNADEVSFYKVLNAVPKTTKSSQGFGG